MFLIDRIDSFLERIFRSKYQLLYVFIFSLIAIVLSRLYLALLCFINDPEVNFIKEMCSIFDNNWYYGVACGGYPVEPNAHSMGDAAAWAFFPLDAILIRLCSLNGLFDYRIVGFILNNILFVIAIILSYKYIMMTRNNHNLVFKYIILMIFGPYCFYFSCMYTESLFFLLNICALIAMQKEHYIRMGIFGLLLSACKVTGVFFVFVVPLFLIKKYTENRQEKIIDYLKKIFTNCNLLIGICMIPAGLFSYMLFLYNLTGDSLAFAHIQIAWRGGVGKGLIHNILFSLISTELLPVYEVFVLFVILVTLYFHIKRYYWECVIYMVPVLVQIFTTTSYMGLARYSIASGVFVMAFVEMMQKHLSKSAQFICYFFLFVLSTILSFSWFMYRPITIG